MADDNRVLVTGASGYIGGRLVPQLLQAGHRVRCLLREPRKLATRPWSDHPNLELVSGDAADSASVERAMDGCGAAYYLIHSMQAVGESYRDFDRRLAEAFATAAKNSGVNRIIYLGGLGETGAGLSEHLASRREVERALASTGVPVTVFRAAMIIGSGSASFEILRYLVERLPVMITPKWVSTESQPIAVRNVLHYLVACLLKQETTGKTFDIGGADTGTYREIMQVMADELGLMKRLIIPVPVLTPRLSSLWIHLVTPLSHRIARPLAEGLKNRVVCRDNTAAELMPQQLLSIRDSIRAALVKRKESQVETAWSDAGPLPGDPDWAGGKVFEDSRSVEVHAPAAFVYRAFCRIGGQNGYYASDWLWRLRGRIDRLIGGPGLRRGRRHPQQLAFGEALDFWRVTKVVPDESLELQAEMKLPGEALLSFEVHNESQSPDRSLLTLVARFKPKGLLGIAYWYAVVPLHGIVFNGMLQGIKRDAQRDYHDQARNDPHKSSPLGIKVEVVDPPRANATLNNRAGQGRTTCAR